MQQLLNKLIEFLRLVKTIAIRNRVNIHREKIVKNKVSLEYWQGIKNVGDQLAPVVFHWMMKQNGLVNQCQGRKHLTTIGSIVANGEFDAVIWGSGVLSMRYAKKLILFKPIVKYDVRAVRGPITREILLAAGYRVPEVYGDPGVIMPFIYQPSATEKLYNVSVIHHISKKNIQDREELHIIQTKTDDYKFFIQEIVRSKLIISSSLHGIILAETYGVPAIFLNEEMDYQLLKYMDWYHATGRTEVKMARSVEEALLMEPMPLPDLTEMQKNLMNSFPVDIFCKKESQG